MSKLTCERRFQHLLRKMLDCEQQAKKLQEQIDALESDWDFMRETIADNKELSKLFKEHCNDNDISEFSTFRDYLA